MMIKTIEAGQFVQHKVNHHRFMIMDVTDDDWAELRKLDDYDHYATPFRTLQVLYDIIPDPRIELHAKIVESYNHV